MSLNKRKCWYSKKCLRFLKCAVLLLVITYLGSVLYLGKTHGEIARLNRMAKSHGENAHQNQTCKQTLRRSNRDKEVKSVKSKPDQPRVDSTRSWRVSSPAGFRWFETEVRARERWRRWVRPRRRGRCSTATPPTWSTSKTSTKTSAG